MDQHWFLQPLKKPSIFHKDKALERQTMLTKPPGSLGTLESLAIRIASLQQTERPRCESIQICIFAGDHGIAQENISAFPQAVTAEMVKNFQSGGAAISVLAKQLSAQLEIINIGVASDLSHIDGIINAPIKRATKNFLYESAMTEEDLFNAFDVGKQAVDRAAQSSVDIFISGEMGIGNTTSATALMCAVLDKDPEQVTGVGTGLNPEQVQHKSMIISKALAFHALDKENVLKILQNLGGFEIAAIVASYIRCGQSGIPCLVDGFICSAAALIAVSIQPSLLEWLIFSHVSAEKAHQELLSSIKGHAILNLNMRLGEASGAAICLPILQSACQLHNSMATFEQASVSEKNE